jgi:hypothetical protein
MTTRRSRPKAKRQRMRRDDPARTAPIRKFSTLLRSADERPADRAAKSNSSEAQDTVAQAVRMGYSVVEEQIRRGRLAAQQVAGGGSAFGAGMTGDASTMIGRLLRHSTDLIALCFDMAGSMTPSTGNGTASVRGASASPDAAQERGARINIEITSTRKNQVTVDLWSNASTDELVVPALHSLDATKAPLMDVSFVAAGPDEPARLKVAVPDAQPADVYSGLIMNRRTEAAVGTLSVRIYD